MKTISGKRDDLEKKVVALIVRKVKETIKEKGRVVLGVPGGRSVAGVFAKLKKEKLPWKEIEIFFVDERFVPLKSKESNYSVAKVLPGNIHPFDFKKGLGKYEKEFKKYGEKFDIAILGLGEDGHIASLFPGHRLKEGNFVLVENSPKPPKERMSASQELLEKSETAILLVFGKEKKEAYEEFGDKKVRVNACPAKLLRKVQDLWVFTDL